MPRARGFTLLELLVVIAVLAIALAAVGLAGAGQARQAQGQASDLALLIPLLGEQTQRQRHWHRSPKSASTWLPMHCLSLISGKPKTCYQQAVLA